MIEERGDGSTTESTADADTYPRQSARTQRFTLGAPRDLTVSPDGRRLVFARSRAGDDSINCLWSLDLGSGEEQLIADPLALLADDLDLPPEERRRRERLREGAGGVTSYTTDRAVTVAAFALGGQLFVAGLLSASARPLPVEGPVFDPRPDPLATCVAYVNGPKLMVGELTGESRTIAGDFDDPPTVTWGSAEFIAAEEMGRHRGYWWSPTGDLLAVCRVDTAPVTRWHIANPAEPEGEPTTHAYPAAGTANADVSLHVFDLVGGEPTDVNWDAARFPYLADVQWNDAGLHLTVQSRDQRRLRLLRVDTESGATSIVWDDEDPEWVELVPGSPTVLHDGRVVACSDRDGSRRLLVDDVPVTPEDLQVRTIISADLDRVIFAANPIDDATVMHIFRSAYTPNLIESLTDEPGVHGAVTAGETVVIRTTTLGEFGTAITLPGGASLQSFAATPLVTPNVTLLRSPERRLHVAVLLPHDYDTNRGAYGDRLPVLLDPYGGPHAQRVVRSRNAFLASQWFADQGFAVVVVDGRGTPGRGSAFERAVFHDLASAALDDQVEGLLAAAADNDALDLDRVAMRGWSFGGYLSALAVMRRPDVFHAGIAGAPVTEWRLYDTHYTERYLGDPIADPAVYEASSLIPLAGELTRPLLLIHGLADDNVVAAHTLRLSSALLAAGKPHEVLPLVGVTHMTPQEIVAENLLLHQLEFLRRTLRIHTPATKRAQA